MREWITENYPHFTEKKYDDPIDYLRSKDIEGFIRYLSFTRRLERGAEDYEKHTYLQYACDVGLPEVVKALLEFGANPNKITQQNDNYPVFIASSKGYAEIIQLFLEIKKPIIFHSEKKSSVLHQVLKGWIEKSNNPDVKNELCDYEKSFNMLLELCKYSLDKTPKIDINYVDNDKCTCLNLAVHLGKKKIVFALLDHNAYLGEIDDCENPLLAEISHEMLESYLDSCITSKQKSPKIINYEINLSYKFLCPPMEHEDNNYGQENFESQKKEIHLKKIKEMDPLVYISEVPALKSLLVHPVISSFIFLKWHRVKLFYYINFLMYLLFLTILGVFILFHDDSSVLFKTYGLCWFVVLLGNLAVCFREFIKFVTNPIKYILNFQNWIEIFMIILIYCLILDILNHGFRIQASATVLLLSWGQILFFIGRHPVQAINLEIFKVVTVNFLKFLVWFSSLIGAFVLCFYMLFEYEKHHSNILEIIEHIWLMSFNTVLMLIGAFDIEEEKFNSYPYSIITRALFLLFVFLVNIVLINLLSGLAVSDIQEIKNVSKIIAMTSNVRFIHDFETFLHEKNIISYIFSVCVKLKLCKKLELFPDALENPNLTIKSNQSLKEKITNAMIDGIYLDDESTIKATSICENNFNLEKSKENGMDIYEKFNSIEKSMNELKEMLKDMN